VGRMMSEKEKKVQVVEGWRVSDESATYSGGSDWRAEWDGWVRRGTELD
jgi:hypothetical protein